MIIAFFQSLLGEVGRKILDFYMEYSLYINGFILVYGSCVILAHKAYDSSLNKIRELLEVETKMGKQKKAKKIYETKIDWDAVQTAYWFPLIAVPKKIWLQKKNTTNLQRLFSRERLLEIIVEKKVEQKEK